MSSYTLSGSGTQAISANVTAVHVTINTPAGSAGLGRANPDNFYDVALLRFGDGTGYWAPVAVVGGPQWIGVPAGASVIGYNVFGATSLTVVEVIGGSPPFGTPTLSLEQLSDVLISSVADTQIIAWNSGAGKWENVNQPSGGTGIGAPKVQLLYEAATDILNGTSITTAGWVDAIANQSFTVDLATSIVVISCGGFISAGGGSDSFIAARLVIDSAGTPINKPISGEYYIGAHGVNFLAGSAPVPVSGLSAASHTVKVQLRSNSATVTATCQPSSHPDQYSFRLSAVEHKTA